jgi:peroxiredoxin
MTTTTSLRPGDRAPEFTLPAANREGDVALASYRGKSAVLLGLFRGLHCPFCRRQIFQLAGINDALAKLGVTPLVVLNSPPERARLYFKYHPTPLTLLADPDARTHEAFHVRGLEITEALMAVRMNPTGELDEALPPTAVNAALNAKDGFAMTAEDEAVVAAHPAQLVGHFLIDRDGIVRWSHVEGGRSGLDNLGKFPTPAEVLTAVRGV